MPALNAVLQPIARARAREHRMRATHTSREEGALLYRDGREYVQFGGNDYLGLRQHHRVIAAASRAAIAEGAGAGASRLISGSHPYYEALEATLAQSKQAEAALVFGSGYAASLGMIPALVAKGDIIFADKLSHACMLDGALLSGATVKRFAHNDMAHLEQLLEAHRSEHNHALIMSEHVFSMDGDKAPLDALLKLKKQHDSWLLIDDAHGLGVLPARPIGEVDVWMGTLSKAAGSYGGYVMGSALLREHLVNRARSFMFSTGLPPSVVAASNEAVQMMQTDSTHRETLWVNIHYLADLLGIKTPESAIVPLIVGEDDTALSAQQALMEAGYFVPAIRPPTVPPGTARLRLSLSALHTEEQLEGLVKALKNMGVAHER